jgi:hypothetical protein
VFICYLKLFDAKMKREFLNIRHPGGGRGLVGSLPFDGDTIRCAGMTKFLGFDKFSKPKPNTGKHLKPFLPQTPPQH